MATPSTSKTPVYQAESKITVKVKVLTEPTERHGAGGDFVSLNVIDSLSKTVKVAFMPLTKKTKMIRDKFYLLRNVSVGQFVRISETSRIMQCGRFSFPEEIEREFHNPPVVTVREALVSPRKRRLSITGELSDVSGVITTPTSRRKILKLSRDDEEIEVKLWGPQADLALPPVGHTVTVSCVNIAEYRGKTDANSTEMTEVREDSETTDFVGEVEGVCFEMDDSTIILKDEEEVCFLTHDQVLSLFPLEMFEESVRVKGKRQGSRILSVERIDEESS